MEKAKDLSNTQIALVPLSHPDKLYFPHISKRDLAYYYHDHIEFILPHLKNRPLSILRCPDGIEHSCFFQKHIESLPESIGHVKVKELNATREHLVIKNEKSLIALVQHGALELHTWGCKSDDIDAPDRMVFDLDPGENVAFAQIIKGAEVARAGLNELGLQSFVKTSGKKGLHVFVPLKRSYSWDDVKNFAEAFAKHMEHIAPKLYVASVSKAKRHHKIFIDYLRNQRGASCVAAYSTRAIEGASISMPLHWDELKKLKSSDQFNFSNIKKRFQMLKKDDPWADYFKLKQRLSLDHFR